MDILVKGLEMSRDGCRCCQFVNRKWNGDFCPFLKREVTGNVERGGFQTDCPLVPVPPHGRLIDADVLGEKAAGRAERRGDMVNVLDKVISLYDIETAPTIIPAEEGE